MIERLSGFDAVMARLARRTSLRDERTERIVSEIIEDVRRRGDAALLESARRFDAPELSAIAVTEAELAGAKLSVPQEEALRTAILRVTNFHAQQRAALTSGMTGIDGGWTWTVEAPGSRLGQRILPMSSAGVYVPGGNATYPSSVVMNAIPGKVAGVKDLAVTTPARADGSLHPAVLFALREVGVARSYKIGGAAAIAALALGTETIARVDQIVGPGNRFVNEAKRQLWGTVGLDGYAGPSEVCVLADDEANAAFAAADLLTQIEHAPDNAGFLVTLSEAKQREILAEVERQVTGAPREETMRQAMAEAGLAIVARDLTEASEFINAIAPEHLTLAVADPDAILSGIKNAGCVLLGEYTPESAGDFCLGPSHTLPTAGAARFGSPVNVLNFWKVQSISRLDPQGLDPLIDVIEAFGAMEGFPAHARGATIRR